MPGGPVPKKKHSRSRRGKRAAHQFLTAPTLVDCPECPTKMRPHHVCITCGYYNGREIVPSEETEVE
ncbi:MAG: 50S ribosomal protein L32 [Dehalococcoidia bacterium]|nr:50S ribosomal protein L32 [Dehalococcoidia bacterium]